MAKVLVAVIAAGCLLGLKLVGDMSLEDDIQSEAHYVEMVCSGAWPDFNRRNPDCSTAQSVLPAVR